MPTCTTMNNTVIDARITLRANFNIDGCDVHQLLEDVYRACWDHTALRGLNLKPQMIAWDALAVAADREALVELLDTAIKHVAANTDSGAVHLRAFPTHDEVYVVFEVKNELPARRLTDRVEEFTAMMARARMRVKTMGGEMAEYSTEDGGSRVCFKLPQWV